MIATGCRWRLLKRAVGRINQSTAPRHSSALPAAAMTKGNAEGCRWEQDMRPGHVCQRPSPCCCQAPPSPGLLPRLPSYPVPAGTGLACKPVLLAWHIRASTPPPWPHPQYHHHHDLVTKTKTQEKKSKKETAQSRSRTWVFHLYLLTHICPHIWSFKVVRRGFQPACYNERWWTC